MTTANLSNHIFSESWWHTLSRDDNDKDKYKDKDARNSSVSVLMYICCNAIWLMTFVHLKTMTKAQTKTKTKTKCSRPDQSAQFTLADLSRTCVLVIVCASNLLQLKTISTFNAKLQKVFLPPGACFLRQNFPNME